MKKWVKNKMLPLFLSLVMVMSMNDISVSAASTIQRARKNGHKVFLCTGRNMAIIGEEIRCVGFDRIIASAGGHVETENHVLFDSILPEETIQECLSIFHVHGLYCRIENTEGIYTDPQMEELLQAANSDKTNSELIRMQKEIEAGIAIQPYDQYPQNGAYKICFTATSLNAIEETKKYLGERFHYIVHPYVNSSSCFNGEIIQKGIDKGKGMELICRYYNRDRKDTVAFGDSMNDYEMMKASGISVAMGNACEELKNMADYVCRDVWEDGFTMDFRKWDFCKERLRKESRG